MDFSIWSFKILYFSPYLDLKTWILLSILTFLLLDNIFTWCYLSSSKDQRCHINLTQIWCTWRICKLTIFIPKTKFASMSWKVPWYSHTKGTVDLFYVLFICHCTVAMLHHTALWYNLISTGNVMGNIELQQKLIDIGHWHCTKQQCKCDEIQTDCLLHRENCSPNNHWLLCDSFVGVTILTIFTQFYESLKNFQFF